MAIVYDFIETVPTFESHEQRAALLLQQKLL